MGDPKIVEEVKKILQNDSISDGEKPELIECCLQEEIKTIIKKPP